VRIIRAGGEYLQSREFKAWAALSMVSGVLFLGVAAQMVLGARSRWALPVGVVALVFIVPEAMHALRTIRRRLRAIRKGRLGERLTTELVSRLPDNYYLLNDITFGGGNIDTSSWVHAASSRLKPNGSPARFAVMAIIGP
jgi:hypothetical protein